MKMNLSVGQFIQQNKINKCENINYSCTLQQNNISFGAINDEFKSSTISAASALADKLLTIGKGNFNIKNVQSVLNSASPVPIDVQEISTTKKQYPVPDSVIAHMLPKYDYETLNLAGSLISYEPKNASATDMKIKIADISHEYAHVLQRYNDKNYFGLKEIGDINKITQIARGAQTILQYSQAEKVQDLWKRNSNVSKVLSSIIGNSFDFKNELSKSETFKSNFNALSKQLAANLNMDESEIRNYIKGWIKQECANEIEAYQVTIDVLKKNKVSNSLIANRTLSQEMYKAIKRDCENL